MESSKIFAVIPAAGQSKRMGQSKLLMPWHGQKVIDSVLAAWTSSNVDKVIVVLCKNDLELIAACQAWNVEMLTLPSATPDMKATIIEGLQHIARHHLPSNQDKVLVAPADLPRITSEVIDRVAEVSGVDQIVVPYFGDKPGHPIRIPWGMTDKIHRLSTEQGLDSLLAASPLHRVEFEAEMRPRDIDTPEDYQREIRPTNR